jgi:hypothetical protein
MRYHPDKNPEGREKFVAVQKAYERLQVSVVLPFIMELLPRIVLFDGILC